MNISFLVFARFPRLGEVKTRLGKQTSQEFSLTLYSSMLLDTLERLQAFQVSKFVFFEGCSVDQAIGYLSTDSSLGTSYQIREQRGRDLGERMWNACHEILDLNPGGVIFLGTDTPSIPLKSIQTAVDLVAQKMFVLGPACDGGYYLLGLPCCRQNLFFDIPWGTEHVLSSTIEKLRDHGYQLLPEWYDIDSSDDLNLLRRDLQSEFPGYPSRTAGLLQGSGKG